MFWSEVDLTIVSFEADISYLHLQHHIHILDILELELRFNLESINLQKDSKLFNLFYGVSNKVFHAVVSSAASTTTFNGYYDCIYLGAVFGYVVDANKFYYDFLWPNISIFFFFFFWLVVVFLWLILIVFWILIILFCFHTFVIFHTLLNDKVQICIWNQPHTA